jgi:carbonic anhydrase
MSTKGQCAGPNQSPINLSQSNVKPCSQLCELKIDDNYVSQGSIYHDVNSPNTKPEDKIDILVLGANSGLSLGSCKFNGDTYTCERLFLTHASLHTIENVQSDAEVFLVFSNPTIKKPLIVSAVVRASPTQNMSSHFFNAFVPYSTKTKQGYTQFSFGEQWSLSMMVPPQASYFVYDGAFPFPINCNPATWVVFNTPITMDTNDFAILIKNRKAFNRQVQQLGNRQVFFNDSKQLTGDVMPRDGKTYMRCKRVGKGTPEIKSVQKVDLKQNIPNKKGGIHNWILKQFYDYGFMGIFEAFILILSIGIGAYLGYNEAKNPMMKYPIIAGQNIAHWIRSKIFKTP